MALMRVLIILVWLGALFLLRRVIGGVLGSTWSRDQHRKSSIPFDHATDDALRARFGPLIEKAMEDVGLGPRTLIEKVAFDKVVAELLDRINSYGFLTFAALRDTLSHNHISLTERAEWADIICGDHLIRLDRLLASRLEGFYRPSELYTRWLERGASLLFGTGWGRALSRYFLLPLLCAWLVLHVLGLLIGAFFSYPKYPVLTQVSLVLLGPVYRVGEDPTLQSALGAAGGVTAVMARRLWPVPPEPHWLWHVGVLAAAILALALPQSRAFQRRWQRCWLVVRELWQVLRRRVWEMLLRILPEATTRLIVACWRPQLFKRYVLKPFLIPFFAIYYFLRNLSKWMVEGIEHVLFMGEQWLRFRSGDGRTSRVARSILRVIWYPFAFWARFYVVVLIEPGINPVKLPLSILMARILLPIYPIIYSVALQPLEETLGILWLARAIITFHIFWLPDVLVFLVWELKENWSLYRANRSPEISAATGGPGSPDGAPPPTPLAPRATGA
jgi:hypothetical protein